MTHFLGFGNHGFTISDRRGENLIGRLGILLWQDYLKLGIVPYVMILPDNVSSINANIRAGALEDSGSRECVMSFTPKEKRLSKL